MDPTTEMICADLLLDIRSEITARSMLSVQIVGVANGRPFHFETYTSPVNHGGNLFSWYLGIETDAGRNEWRNYTGFGWG